jgi:predicted PurR-regulated permease PerM
VRRTLILATLWLFIAAIVFFFRFVLLPFGLAVLLAFIIEPIVEAIVARRIFGKRVSRTVAVLSIYVLFGLFVWAFGSWAVGQLSREVAKLGALSTKLIHEVEPMANDLLNRTVAFADENNIPVDREEIETFFKQNIQLLAEEVGHNSAKVVSFGRDLVRGTFGAIFGTFLVLMLTAFLSIDRQRIQKFFWSLVPPEYHGGYGVITSGISQGLAGVVRGQVTICLANGVFTFIGLWLFGVKLPLLLAMLATVFSLIPIFGSILSSIPIVAVALTDSFAKGVFMLLWIIGVHLLEANFLNPKIMGTAARIHPVIVVFALIVGEQTSGLIGALFAVPIASVVLTVFKFLHKRALDGVKESEAAHPPLLLPAPAPREDSEKPTPPTAELRKSS